MEILYAGLFYVIVSLLVSIWFSFRVELEMGLVFQLMVGYIVFSLITVWPLMIFFPFFNTNGQVEPMDMIAYLMIMVISILIFVGVLKVKPFLDFLNNYGNFGTNARRLISIFVFVFFLGTLYSMYYFGVLMYNLM